MTSAQEALVAAFKAANAAATPLDGCDPANAPTLAKIDALLRDLALRIQASGLQMDSVGQWVPPGPGTYNFAEG